MALLAKPSLALDRLHFSHLNISTISSPATKRRYMNMAQQPAWLRTILRDTSSPAKLYVWTPSSLNLSYTQPQSKASNSIQRRVYVIGVGNLGRMYAAYMAQIKPTPPPITLVVHKKELLSQWVESNGIEVTRQGQCHQSKNFDIEFWSEDKPADGNVREVADGEKLQNVLVTTKASAALPEVDRIRRYLDASSTVAFAQNGMSKLWPPHGAAYMAHRYPTKNSGFNALACVTNHGVRSQGPFQSIHASPTDTYVGSVLTQQSAPDDTSSITYLTNQLMSAPFINAQRFNRADLWVRQLEKLIINSCINPLCTILRQKNGYIFEDPEGTNAQIINNLLGESSVILQRLINYEGSAEILASSPSLSDSSDVESSMHSLREDLVERFSQSCLKEMLYAYGQRVKENTCSMLQDVLAGKTTEIQDFNGWLVDMARFLDPSLETTTHQKVIDLVESGETLTDEDFAKHCLPREVQQLLTIPK